MLSYLNALLRAANGPLPIKLALQGDQGRTALVSLIGIDEYGIVTRMDASNRMHPWSAVRAIEVTDPKR